MRVLLADDHDFVRLGLRTVLAEEGAFDIVAEESEGNGALAAILRLVPDVAVLDIEMPGLTGLEIAGAVSSRHLPTSVLVLSMHKEDAFVLAALAAGVEGYVLKEDAPEELLAAVRAAARHELYLSKGLSAALAEPERARRAARGGAAR